MDDQSDNTEPFFGMPQGYQYLSCCGSGSYGITYLVRDFSGVEMVLKIVGKTGDRSIWERELHGLKAFRKLSQGHPNLVQIYHVEDSPEYFYYTMPPADNLSREKGTYLPATLENVLKRYRLSPERVLKIGHALLDAVEFLHRSGLVHRDIKPSNIIFINGELKLSDIGLIREMEGNVSLVGSPDFLPPEMLQRRIAQFDTKYDLYAIGKVLYCALTGGTCKDFPHVDLSLLHSRIAMRLNRVILEVCDSNPEWRIDTIETFRRHLNGDYDTKPVRNFLLHILRTSGGYLKENLHIPVYLSLAAFSILGALILFDVRNAGPRVSPTVLKPSASVSVQARNLSDAIFRKDTVLLSHLLQENSICRTLLKQDPDYLLKALSLGSPELLRLLLKHGADPNACFKDGKTPLMRAAEAGNLQEIRILLEFGADKEKLDSSGKNASAYAARTGEKEIRTLLQ